MKIKKYKIANFRKALQKLQNIQIRIYPRPAKKTAKLLKVHKLQILREVDSAKTSK